MGGLSPGTRKTVRKVSTLSKSLFDRNPKFFVSNCPSCSQDHHSDRKVISTLGTGAKVTTRLHVIILAPRLIRGKACQGCPIPQYSSNQRWLTVYKFILVSSFLESYWALHKLLDGVQCGPSFHTAWLQKIYATKQSGVLRRAPACFQVDFRRHMSWQVLNWK